MTLPQITAIMPLVILSATIVIVLLAIALHRNHLLTHVLTLAGLALSAAWLFMYPIPLPQQLSFLITVDGYALYFFALIIVSGFAVALLSFRYLGERSSTPEEFSLFLLLATLGSCVIAASSHFVSFFLGLELLSVSLYAMIAYTRPAELSVEAGVKYLILAAVSAAFLLFGMALVYEQTGTMEFSRLSLFGPIAGGVDLALLIAGYGLVAVGIGFKLALVPFHLWTPDVYEGAPVPAAAFVATVSKGAMFALLLRFFLNAQFQFSGPLVLMFTLIAVGSILLGNFLGLLQKSVRRLLAYSSIAHLGYLLVAFLASGPLVPAAVAFYLAAYCATTIGSFGVLAVLSTREHEAGDIDDFRGMSRTHPWLTLFFTVMLFSLAGIPLTAGFVGKFYVVLAGVDSSLWLPVVVLVAGSAIGLFYYLRVIVTMFLPVPAPADGTASRQSLPVAGVVTLVALTIFILWMGIFPTQLIALLNAAASGFAVP